MTRIVLAVGLISLTAGVTAAVGGPADRAEQAAGAGG
jgi:hypothetical protein